MGPEEYSQ
jgi:hypothetical protein